MDFIASIDMTGWVALVFAAVMAGFTKAGLSGANIVSIPILAVIFGARESSGLLLGILMTADLVAISKYRKDGNFAHLRRLMPWSTAGVLLGALVGGMIPDRTFRTLMMLFILASAVIMVFRETRSGAWILPEKWWAAAPLGLLAGFSSMVGNSAGAVMGLYLLSSGLGKGHIVGTSAWFFFLINIVKLPFHIFSWHTLSPATLATDLIVAPVAVLSTILGVRVVKAIPEKPYRWFLIVVSVIGGLYLVIR